MPLSVTHRATLRAHPSTPNDAISSFEVEVTVTDSEFLVLRYILCADMSRIRVPADEPAARGRADGLWHHTCFEAFLRSRPEGGYHELNFSPAKQWAAYHFDAYRQGMKPLVLPQPPEISVRAVAKELELDAAVHLPSRVAAAPARLALGVTAVIEDDGGRLSYWSARHPSGQPDFHHPDHIFFELSP